MVAQIIDINAREFRLNGVLYIKNFIAIYYHNGVKIVNAYDNRIELVPSIKYNEITVNGNSYADAETLSNVLSSLLFSKIVNEVDLPSYQTLALLNSEFAAPQEHNTAEVTNDPVTANNGSYSYYNGAWVKFADTQATVNANAIAQIIIDLDTEEAARIAADAALQVNIDTAQTTADTAKVLAILAI